MGHTVMLPVLGLMLTPLHKTMFHTYLLFTMLKNDQYRL
jgi:hypothetical protein